MNVHYYVSAALLGLLMAGCQSSFDTDVLERELRTQEDYIYELQDEIDQYKRALTQCKKQDNHETSTSRQAPAASKEPAGPPDFGPEIFRPPTIEPGIPVEPGNPHAPGPDSGQAAPGAGAAAGLLPEPDGPVPDLAPAATARKASSRTADAPRADRGSDGPRPAAEKSDDPVPLQGVETAPIEEILFDRSRIHGLEVDGKPGDDGIVGVIRARTAAGTHVAPAGDLSLMVIAPSPHGEPKRLARWDFTAAELASRRSRARGGTRLSVDLPWPAGPPKTGPFKLWARLVTPDGRKLLSRLDMEVDRAGKIAAVAAPASEASRGTETAWEARGPHGGPRGWAARASAATRPPAARSQADGQVPHLATRPGAQQGPADRPVWKPYR